MMSARLLMRRILFFCIIIGLHGELTEAGRTAFPKNFKMSSTIASSIIQAVNKPQSSSNRLAVEREINFLASKAAKDPKKFKKPIRTGSAYRTLWSSVTADNIIGQIASQKPSVILGGDSWQVISKDGKKTENIVFWDFGFDIGVRMAGLADLSPLGRNEVGYNLKIRGLEFRVGKANDVPEKRGLMGSDNMNNTYSFRPLYLDENKVLKNGVGTLSVLYNDGTIRITEDKVQKNFYLHAIEPYGDCFLNDIAFDSSVKSYDNIADPLSSGLGPWLTKKIGANGMKILGAISVVPYILFIYRFVSMLPGWQQLSNP